MHTLSAFNALCSLVLTATDETQIAEVLRASLLDLVGTQHKTRIDLLPVHSAQAPSPAPHESVASIGTPEAAFNESLEYEEHSAAFGGGTALPPLAACFSHLTTQAAMNRSIVEEFVEESTTAAKRRKVVSFVPVTSIHLDAETPVRHVIMIT